MSHIIDEARKALSIPDEDLARLLGIAPGRSKNTFSRWRTGDRIIDDARKRLIIAYMAGYRPADWPKGTEDEN